MGKKEIRGFHADDEKMGSTFGVQVKMKEGSKIKDITLQIGFSPISKLADAKVGRKKDEKSFQLSRDWRNVLTGPK